MFIFIVEILGYSVELLNLVSKHLPLLLVFEDLLSELLDLHLIVFGVE